MIEQLLQQAPQFSYFQALRLLRLHARENGWDVANIRTRPQLSLAFPETDLAEIRWLAPQCSDAEDGMHATETVLQQAAENIADSVTSTWAEWQKGSPPSHEAAPAILQITANFFGLYGVASPLPAYYTEELINEQREERHATREFLDVLHQRLYPLLHQAWLKPRLQLRIWEEHEARALSYVQALAGLPQEPGRKPDVQEKADVLRYAGLFSQKPRSALGLQTLLADAFPAVEVHIESCVAKWEPIASTQQLRLGMQAHELGVDTLLGQRVHERANAICIHLHSLDAVSYQALLPGATQHQRLQHLVRLYLGVSLDVDVQLHPQRNTAQAAQLSAPMWGRLGFDAWLAPTSGDILHTSPFALALQ